VYKDRAKRSNLVQEQIERRGNAAGMQVVKEATELVEREARLMRAAQDAKQRKDAEKVEREHAARIKSQQEVQHSWAAQIALKEKAAVQRKAETVQFVEEV
jgi:hypothetical protein